MIAVRGIIQAVLSQYALSPWGIHGIAHWGRVWEGGLRVAEKTDADAEVVRLFALFHDSRRINDGLDPGHGLRGAQLAASMRGKLFDISDDRFELLYAACAGHTDGHTEADITLQACWDGDRLDLNRVSILPDPKQLCTEAARDVQVMEWANERSRSNFVPEIVRLEWGM